ncbi:MAG: type II secretion system F family protein [Desulfovibrionaceae bacterium]
MPVFQYTAFTDSGSRVSGSLEADNLDAAYRMVADRGYIPEKVKQGGKLSTAAGGTGSLGLKAMLSKVKPQDLILFTKQFKTMLNAGISVLGSLQVLEAQTENPRLKAAVIQMAQDITGGASMFKAFHNQKGIFSDLYCNMIRAGEVSGTLIQVLDRLIYIIEHENKVKKDIQSALTYPIIVVVALVGAFVVLITVVLPKFIDLFKKQGVALPFPTRVCMEIYEFISAHWVLLVVGVIGGIVGLIAYIRTPHGRLVKDTILLHLPILGPVFTKAAMSRFGSIFAILQSSGVTVLDSVQILSSTIGNAAVSKEFDGVREKLEQGKGLAAPLRNAKYFTPMLITMVAIGEESGQLEEMLKEVSVHYDYEVEYAVSKMSELLGPALVACLSGVVGFFALAILLPLVELMQNAMKAMG